MRSDAERCAANVQPLARRRLLDRWPLNMLHGWVSNGVLVEVELYSILGLRRLRRRLRPPAVGTNPPGTIWHSEEWIFSRHLAGYPGYGLYNVFTLGPLL